MFNTFQIIANTGGHFPENIPSSRNTSPTVSADQGEVETMQTTETLKSHSEKEDSSPINEILSTTPKSSRMSGDELMDGVVLTRNEENGFLNPNDLSPILSQKLECLNNQTTEIISPINEEDEEDVNVEMSELKELKRKRDSFEDVSLMSTDSIALGSVSSAKKPKLIRTGSITRSLKRSMSFVGIRTPIASMLRPRRNSVDPNASINSMVSIDSTLNESTKKPVREKLREMRDRITRSSKREINITPKTVKLASSNLKCLSKICKLKNSERCETPEKQFFDETTDLTDFKTPLLPKSTNPTSFIAHRHSVCGVGSVSAMTDDLKISVEMPPVRKSLAADSSTGNNTLDPCIGSAAVLHRNDPSSNATAMNECDISVYHINERNPVLFFIFHIRIKIKFLKVCEPLLNVVKECLLVFYLS